MRRSNVTFLVALALTSTLPSCGGAPRRDHCPCSPDGGTQARDAGLQTRDATFVAVDACRELDEGGARAADGGAPFFKERVQSAREKMELLRAEHWLDRRENAARLLKELARALASAPYIDQSVRRQVCEANRHADAVIAEEGGPFRGASEIKAGLSALLDALQTHVREGDVKRARIWLVSALRAVEGIDEKGMVAFQGASIQDAFRTTTDLFLVLAE